MIRYRVGRRDELRRGCRKTQQRLHPRRTRSLKLLSFFCLIFDSELGRDLRESVLQKIFGFYSCYFFDGIMKMLLVEPYLHLTPLLGPEDETALTETITEAMTELAERL